MLNDMVILSLTESPAVLIPVPPAIFNVSVVESATGDVPESADMVSNKD